MTSIVVLKAPGGGYYACKPGTIGEILRATSTIGEMLVWLRNQFEPLEPKDGRPHDQTPAAPVGR